MKQYMQRKGKTEQKSNLAVSFRPWLLLLTLIVCSVAVYLLYRLLMSAVDPEIVLILYTAASSACIVAYLIYNRGFSRKNVTRDMLPDSWDEQKKTEFIEDGKRRIKKSKPLLIVILAFMFTYVMELTELVVIPFLADFFGSIK